MRYVLHTVPKCCLAIVLAAMVSLPAGCAQPPQENATDPLTAPQPPLLRRDEASEGDGNAYRLLIRMETAMVELPLGMASGSEGIWSYLDEESVREVHTPALGINGVRVGRGAAGTWADVASILRQMTGRKMRESVTTAPPGRTLHIVLKSDLPTQTIFVYSEDQTVRGEDYPPGNNLLSVVCTLNEDDPSKVLLTIVPQVRTSRRRPRFASEPGGVPVMVSRPDIYPLTPLTFQITVQSNDFVVIGPGGLWRRTSSVGRQFLIGDNEGVPFETVIILKPFVYAEPLAPVQTQGAGP
jgi:hypothetical protein